MIHDEICTYEVCLLAKEKGFPLQKVIKQDGRAFFYELPQSHPDWANCDAWYLPTQSLLQRWLREEKRVNICIDNDLDFDDEKFVYEWQITEKENFDNGGFEIHRYNSDEPHSTYELALEDALKYALEHLVL